MLNILHKHILHNSGAYLFQQPKITTKISEIFHGQTNGVNESNGTD